MSSEKSADVELTMFFKKLDVKDYIFSNDILIVLLDFYLFFLSFKQVSSFFRNSLKSFLIF